ncbi:dipeptidyl carboxypeptidase II [Bacteroidia bacterium]|nr:dipeptidyl carboxypeptidase II [Bacteroidia bacterium]
MKKIIVLVCAIFMMYSCTNNQNPFFEEVWNTPYGVPPFDKITEAHFKPAFEEGMKRHNQEIQAIINNPEAPTFENTIVAFENTGRFLERVNIVFSGLSGSERTATMGKLEQELSPVLSKHVDEINTNTALFARIKTVYEQQKQNASLQGEDLALLNETFKGFVRGGANLSDADKQTLKTINARLAELSSQYRNNAMNDNNAYRLVIKDAAELSGLPDNTVAEAKALATRNNEPDAWMFTLDNPCRIPFLTYSDNRALREQMYKAYLNKGNNDNANDNKKVAAQMASLQHQKAVLLGYETAADFILANRMAKDTKTVMDFLDKLWKPTQKVVANEIKTLQAMIDAEQGGFKLAGWDWWYYTEKVRKSHYALDESEVSQYLVLENVTAGAFELAHRLYGLTFETLNDIPKFNAEAHAYLVKDENGEDLAIFYTDYFPRATKRGGAWMTSYRKEEGYPGQRVLPVIINICNLTRGVDGKPSLITMDEAETVFHEFGHALHGILSKCKYRSIAGTSVKRDFVELPSQVMENWVFRPEMLQLYAKHYETGAVIPDALIAKINKASKFNQGFKTMEYLAASYLDLAWFTLKTDEEQNTSEFEAAAMAKIQLPSEIAPRYRSTYFTHVFGGGYTAGYYCYIWAEVLDSDAFQTFVKTGNVFDTATAKRFRTEILERGNSDEPMTLYKNFKGAEPTTDAILEKRGLK